MSSANFSFDTNDYSIKVHDDQTILIEEGAKASQKTDSTIRELTTIINSIDSGKQRIQNSKLLQKFILCTPEGCAGVINALPKNSRDVIQNPTLALNFIAKFGLQLTH